MIDYNFHTIGEKLKQYRLAKGMTQKRLGELAGISDSFISDMETGRGTMGSTINVQKIYKLAVALDVKLDNLAGTNIENTPSDNEVTNKILSKTNDLSDVDIEILISILNAVEISKKFGK